MDVDECVRISSLSTANLRPGPEAHDLLQLMFRRRAYNARKRWRESRGPSRRRRARQMALGAFTSRRPGIDSTVA